MTEQIKKWGESIRYWARFLIGIAILVGMLVFDIHLDKEVPQWLYLFPAYLIGIDISTIFKPR